ncbi:hypothetical protein HPB49_004755 [Dermacentor silvarum]|uniref:Uncharacterized protein n=1 Tax=Dermacentor silvarum TaxID=543639 RepID=A0ACB8CJK4_DERSI|nr:hypothetical protein HPB49_004755 [Dermacentor silvarum]
MTKIIARFVARGMHLYNVVEEPSFLDMMKFAMPDYAVLSRTTFSRAIIPDLYASSKEKIIEGTSAVARSSWNGVQCFGRTFQLCVSDAKREVSGILQLCAKARAIVARDKRSAKARGRLQEIQRNMQLDPLEVIQDAPTRWNSEHAMMARLVKLRTVITVELSESDAVPHLNASLSLPPKSAVRNLADFLGHLSLSKYVPMLEAQGIDLDQFLTFGDTQLEQAGIRLVGPKRKMAIAISCWNERERYQAEHKGTAQNPLQ